MRIAFCGAAGTGKTTLVKELLKLKEFRNHKQYENAQRVLHNGLKNFPHSGAANNISQVGITTCVSYQVIANDNIICDRSIIDAFAYAKLAKDVNIEQEIEDTFNEVIYLYDLLIYVPVEFKIQGDGFRVTDMDFIKQTDEAIMYYLKKYQVDYLKVTGSVEERLSQIKNKLKI